MTVEKAHICSWESQEEEIETGPKQYLKVSRLKYFPSWKIPKGPAVTLAGEQCGQCWGWSLPKYFGVAVGRLCLRLSWGLFGAGDQLCWTVKVMSMHHLLTLPWLLGCHPPHSELSKNWQTEWRSPGPLAPRIEHKCLPEDTTSHETPGYFGPYASFSGPRTSNVKMLQSNEDVYFCTEPLTCYPPVYFHPAPQHCN